MVQFDEFNEINFAYDYLDVGIGKESKRMVEIAVNIPGSSSPFGFVTIF